MEKENAILCEHSPTLPEDLGRIIQMFKDHVGGNDPEVSAGEGQSDRVCLHYPVSSTY
jgi:hypothetical protein